MSEPCCCVDGSPRDGEGGLVKRHRRPIPRVQAPLGVRGVPVPCCRDPARGALVHAVRPFVPGPGGASRGARNRLRSRDRVPVGPAIHATAHRRGRLLPAQGRRPMVRRRDVC